MKHIPVPIFLQSANQSVYFIAIIYILVQDSKGQSGFFTPFSSSLAAQLHFNTSHKDIDFALSGKTHFILPVLWQILQCGVLT